MPSQCLCIDLDNTLLVQAKNVSCEHRGLRHLELVTLKTATAIYEFYSINTQAMKKIFAALLNNNVKIVFVTSSRYDTSILKALEDLYELTRGSLLECLYINKSSKFYKPKIRKGSIIKAAQEDGFIPIDAEIFLLDNDDKHLKDAAAHGINPIKAAGYPDDESELCNDYLYELLIKIKLSVSFSITDPAHRSMKRFRMS